MKTFLSLVAEDLLKQYGADMRHVTVVFPSKRAGLFLSQELLALSDKPVWAPHYITMGELFKNFSTRLLADPIDCICRLYTLYIKHVGHEIRTEEGELAFSRETLDRFWGWGEVLMADFDDIDKHLADANQVFRHVHDLAELQNIDYLDEDQKRILARFFGYFSAEDNSILRQRFIRLWDKMYDIYSELKSELLQENQLWEGALYREVCEGIKENPLVVSNMADVCFVGFNVLNNVEEELMKALSHQARFYWDYDEYYTRNTEHEAGEFMRRNLSQFPSALPAENFRNFENLKEITYITCSTDNAAARYTSQWLKNGLDKEERMNAVVLCNEQLMLPVMHSIPHGNDSDNPKQINVTMGFPLSDTPVYSFINALLSMQTDGWDHEHSRFRYAFMQSVLHHPYAKYLEHEALLNYKGNTQTEILEYVAEILEMVGRSFTLISTPDIYEQLYIESIYQTHRIVHKFLQFLRRPDNLLLIQHTTLRRLMRNVMSSTSIPFHGEPATGLQIMGVLETRCLDFSHLLMLSVEEDHLPRNTQQNSLIPPVVREAYALTTSRHKICIFAYYFYRLIQRTTHLTCVFNENCVGAEHHEISRFLRQLLAERTSQQLKVNKFTLGCIPQYSTPLQIQIDKTPKIMQKMYNIYCTEFNQNPRYLSPTAINSYCLCPMQFYFRYVEGLKSLEEDTDEISPSLFGNIFHDASQIFYLDLKQRHKGEKTIEKVHLLPFLQKENSHLRQCIELAFDLNVFHPYKNEKEKDLRIAEYLASRQIPANNYIGQTVIVRDVLKRYLNNLIQCDFHLAPFTIHELEMECKTDLQIQVKGQKLTLHTGGRIDRLDELNDGTLRVFDYKTGNVHEYTKDLKSIFSRGKEHPGYVFQTCLYALALKRDAQWKHQKIISPALFYLRKSHDKEYDPRVFIKKNDTKDKTANFCDLEEDFSSELNHLLVEIFSPDVPFTQVETNDVCMNCDFALICNRLKTRKDN